MKFSAEYWEGYEAGSDANASMACPYSLRSDKGLDWLRGWDAGDADRRAEEDAAA